jgi:hypothetical protein
MTIIYSLKLKSLLQANSFEEFARTKYLPALETGPTRVGQLLGARLLRQQRAHESDPIDLENRFLLLFEWSGVWIDLPRSTDPTVQKVFDVFDAEVTRLGHFETVGTLAGRAI